jgi:hypothetical protein
MIQVMLWLLCLSVVVMIAGWLKTVDEYFRAQTQGILNSMTQSLSQVYTCFL